MNADRRILTLDGLDSVIERHGEPRAPIVVLMASMLIRPRSYVRLVHRLAKAFHVVTIEPPGSGVASKLPKPWTFQDYADRLAATLDALDLRDVTLIGHSNSAAVAMLAAAPDHPASRRIARVVLTDSVGADPRHGFWRIGMGRVLDGVFEPGFSITALADIFWNLFRHNQNFLAEIHQAIHWDAREHAPRVRLPALIAWGGRDLTFLPWVGHRLLTMIPHASYHLLRGGHHDWLATNPAEFAEAIEAFVTASSRSITPSPGTPGEGWGEGSRSDRDPTIKAHRAEPSPSPLPAYRARENAAPRDTDPDGLYSER